MNKGTKSLLSLALAADIILLGGCIAAKKIDSKETGKNNIQSEIIDDNTIIKDETVLKSEDDVIIVDTIDEGEIIDEDSIEMIDTITEECTIDEEILDETLKWTICNNYAYLTKSAYVFADESFENPIELIEPYQKIYRESTNGNWDYVITPSGTIGYMEPYLLKTLPSKFVEVDISEQTTYLVENYETIFQTLNVTGKDISPTDTGCYQIAYKETDTYLKGVNPNGTTYSSHVSFWMPYNGGEGLHDADEWRYGVYGGEIYHENGSHGCVNMPYDAAEFIYNNVEAGTVVLVHN